MARDPSGPVPGDRGAGSATRRSRPSGRPSSATSSPSSSGWTARSADLGQMKEDIRGAGGAVQAGERRRRRRRPAPAVHRRPPGGPRRPSRRLDLHREGLEPHLARRLRRRDPVAREGARACRRATIQAQSLLGWAQMLHEDYDDALGTFSRVLMKEPANALARINVGLHLPQEADLRRGDRAPVQGHPPGQRPQGDAVRALLSRAGVPRARDVRGRPDLLPEDPASWART